ncbi:hypothetical protein G8A07_13915 [Roseateles sp. DAIF2]|uniref:hypothetical protein n=1 Tax=Roseateles sp. DAIF2 TaxID=2714952 RepID=UPI0018A2A548|nr:hypothetical protein [Roseateles sp. DAIF2]QPF73906.1 hypothetical protein G8A07_13915 [Roseateles sp. DAIF2]
MTMMNDGISDSWSRRRLVRLLAASSAAASPWPAALANSGPAELFVISTLYSRHKLAPNYGLPALRRVVEAVKPDALVLDVTPTELRTRKVWPGKIEYLELIFPYLDATGAKAYASEPDEPLFTELSGGAGRAYKAFGDGNPVGAKALDALKAAAYQALAAGWASAADVNSERTDRMIAGLRELEEGLVGGEVGRLQEQWDRHHAERLLEVLREAQRGRRVLMLVGIESRYRVLEALKAAGGPEPVPTERWLRERGL